jgi:hypothetical protein
MVILSAETHSEATPCFCEQLPKCNHGYLEFQIDMFKGIQVHNAVYLFIGNEQKIYYEQEIIILVYLFLSSPDVLSTVAHLH